MLGAFAAPACRRTHVSTTPPASHADLEQDAHLLEGGLGAYSTNVSEASALATPVQPTQTDAMARIPGGDFLMGTKDGSPTEAPTHRVHVAAFEMDVTEVTAAKYADCVDARRCTPAKSGNFCTYGRADAAEHPINCVEWKQANDYCAYAGKRLPTEEEWEYAARGTDGRIFPWGDELPASQPCWRRGDYYDVQHGTCPAGSSPADRSPFAVLDMSGNVGEWTSSRMSDNYASPRRGPEVVVRGGDWRVGTNIKLMRASSRGWFTATVQSDGLGFRCAR
jgi:formylglycine-generating enzyme required for sulfatase activity